MGVGGHTAWLKNSSTTPGAVLGVWDDALQTQPLSPETPHPVHTQTHHLHRGPVCTHINMLTVCIHPANVLVTHEDGHFLTGVKNLECRSLL